MFCPEMKMLPFRLEPYVYMSVYIYVYTVTISLFFFVCTLYVIYNLHKMLKFFLLESLQFGTKSVYLFRQMRNMIGFMVQWSQNFMFFKAQVETIDGDGGKDKEKVTASALFLIRNDVL